MGSEGCGVDEDETPSIGGELDKAVDEDGGTICCEEIEVFVCGWGWNKALKERNVDTCWRDDWTRGGWRGAGQGGLMTGGYDGSCEHVCRNAEVIAYVGTSISCTGRGDWAAGNLSHIEIIRNRMCYMYIPIVRVNLVLYARHEAIKSSGCLFLGCGSRQGARLRMTQNDHIAKGVVNACNYNRQLRILQPR